MFALHHTQENHWIQS